MLQWKCTFNISFEPLNDGEYQPNAVTLAFLYQLMSSR